MIHPQPSKASQVCIGGVAVPSSKLKRCPEITATDDQTLPVDHAGLIIGRDPGPLADPRQIAAAVRWLQARASGGRTRTGRISSYSIKHAAEKWCGDYISNGAMILAAYRCRFAIEVESRVVGSPLNCRVGISLRHYKRLAESNPGTWGSVLRAGVAADTAQTPLAGKKPAIETEVVV